MIDDKIDDLKQFLAATVGQSETRIRQDLGSRIDKVESHIDNLENHVDSLESEMHDGFAYIADIRACSGSPSEAKISSL